MRTINRVNLASAALVCAIAAVVTVGQRIRPGCIQGHRAPGQGRREDRDPGGHGRAHDRRGCGLGAELEQMDAHANRSPQECHHGADQAQAHQFLPPAPDTCGQVAAGNGAVWVSMRTDNVVARVDPTTSKVTAMIPVGQEPDGIAASPGAVWVANHGGATSGPSVSRIDPATNQVVATISVGPTTACCSDHMGVIPGDGSVWVTVPNGNALVESTRDECGHGDDHLDEAEDQPCGGVAVSKAAVWIAGAHCGSVIRQIDPRTNRPTGRRINGSVSPIKSASPSARSGCRTSTRGRSCASTPDSQDHRHLAGRRDPGTPDRRTRSVWVRDDTGNILRIAPRR